MKGYLSIPEIAEKWGISERLANQYCIEGRISGAERFGRSWAIPVDAVKPGRRTKGAEPPMGAAAPVVMPAAPVGIVPMPLLNTPFALGHCQEAVAAIADRDLRQLATAEYHYFSGRAEQAAQEAELLLTHPDPVLRLSACWIYGYSNLATDHISRARKALEEIRCTLAGLDDRATPQQRALAACIAAGASILLHLPLPEGLPPLQKCLPLLPPGLRLFGIYIAAHQAYLNESYGTCIGMVEAALSFETVIYPIPTIYLHLVATMAYMSLKQPEKAREHLLTAWELARPDGLLEALGEHHGLLGGMLEAVLKKEWPEDFRQIIEITYSFSAGWRKIHNPVTGHDVADNLTTTEFATAMLAARGWSNQEIGDHMGISPNTVKRYISTALQKLNITQRKELKQFMLK